jgi:hypothetical protein
MLAHCSLLDLRSVSEGGSELGAKQARERPKQINNWKFKDQSNYHFEILSR